MKKIYAIVAVVAAVFMVSCGGSATPSDVAVDSYNYVIDGDYEKFAETIQYNVESEEELAQAKAMIISMIKEKAVPQMEAKGGVKSVEAINEVMAEDGKSAVVTVKLVYGDESEDTEDLKVVLNDEGEWKLSMEK